MQGQLSIDFTKVNGHIVPAITCKYPKSSSNDLRDGMIKEFGDSLGGVSHWAIVRFTGETEQHQVFQITPVKTNEVSDFLSDVEHRIFYGDALQKEKFLLEKVNSMAEQSLDPESFENWEKIKELLIKTRKLEGNI